MLPGEPLTTFDKLIAYLETIDPDRPDEVEIVQYLHQSYENANINDDLKESLRIEINSLFAWLKDGTWFATLYGIQNTHLPTDISYIDTRLATRNVSMKMRPLCGRNYVCGLRR